MGRNITKEGSPRCEKCRVPLRWCTCEGFQTLSSALSVDVLIHDLEAFRPSSTGHLIQRVMPGSRQHIFRPERPLDRESIILPGKSFWILHPLGEPMPADADPAKIQVLLLDGNWRQAGDMTKAVDSWGRRVSLPMQGQSRYWLRSQLRDDHFSTAEALLRLFELMGLREEYRILRLQFELHVYAGLRSRGRKQEAESFLQNSPLPTALPELLAKLNTRQTNPETGLNRGA